MNTDNTSFLPEAETKIQMIKGDFKRKTEELPAQQSRNCYAGIHSAAVVQAVQSYFRQRRTGRAKRSMNG
jgi:hypothetical protein